MIFNTGGNEAAGEHDNDYEWDGEVTNEADNEVDAEVDEEVESETDSESLITITSVFDIKGNLKSSYIGVVREIDSEDPDEITDETDETLDVFDKDKRTEAEMIYGNARHKRFDPVEDGKSEFWSGRNKGGEKGRMEYDAIKEEWVWKKKNRRYRR